jgi:hypothetical protein
MIAYRYTIGNTTTETLDLTTIPIDVDYETFDIELEEDVPIVTEPTKEELIQIVQELQEKLTQVTEQLNNL